ncbi:MAG: twin-arginine translocase TatA/TatE family subunit [Flavobacteriales bacterium]|jgi:sec-independent protein translocase protein TatA
MGATEIVFVFVIYLLFFGAKGIPSLAKTIGKATYQFREARNDIQREIMSSAKGITDSAKEVRNEIENAAQLAQREAKKAHEAIEKSVKPTPIQPEVQEPINPLTPSDSISSSGVKKEDSISETPESGKEDQPST